MAKYNILIFYCVACCFSKFCHWKWIKCEMAKCPWWLNIKFKWYSVTDFRRKKWREATTITITKTATHTQWHCEFVCCEGVNFRLQNIYWYHKNRIYISIDLIVNDFFCSACCMQTVLLPSLSHFFSISITWHIVQTNIRSIKIIEQHFMAPSLVALNVRYLL